jgi:hypothetical protein
MSLTARHRRASRLCTFRPPIEIRLQGCAPLYVFGGGMARFFILPVISKNSNVRDIKDIRVTKLFDDQGLTVEQRSPQPADPAFGDG